MIFTGDRYELLPYIPSALYSNQNINLRVPLLICQNGLTITNCTFTFPQDYDFDQPHIAINAKRVTIMHCSFVYAKDDMQSIYALADEAAREVV